MGTSGRFGRGVFDAATGAYSPATASRLDPLSRKAGQQLGYQSGRAVKAVWRKIYPDRIKTELMRELLTDLVRIPIHTATLERSPHAHAPHSKQFAAVSLACSLGALAALHWQVLRLRDSSRRPAQVQRPLHSHQSTLLGGGQWLAALKSRATWPMRSGGIRILWREAEASRRRAYWVASAFGGLAALAMVAFNVMLPLKSVEPFVIRVDNTTGVTDVVPVYVGKGEVRGGGDPLLVA